MVAAVMFVASLFSILGAGLGLSQRFLFCGIASQTIQNAIFGFTFIFHTTCPPSWVEPTIHM